MLGPMTDAVSEPRLRELGEALLTRDRDAHARAVGELAATGDERAVPYLFEVAVIDSIANDWAGFGFPEVLRERDPPRYLELPEVAWPGVIDALGELAPPDYDAEHAWIQWETWYSQQDLALPPGFDDWKLRLYKAYVPPVGSLLEAQPRSFELEAVRWGNTDRSFLAALNAPTFVRAAEADAYLEDDHHVFGFEVRDEAYAVPRWILFPHELTNFTVGDVPLSLTYCTLCNAPILYDRRLGDRTLTFGSTGLLWRGNKLMFDEETESLWSQHRGDALAGPLFEQSASLDIRPATQTEWAAWRAEHPGTRVLDLETGFDLDYAHYEGNIGFFEHYWTREDVVQPGVRTEDSELPEKAEVYGVTGGDPGSIRVYPVEAVREHGPFADEIDGRQVVVVIDNTDDVAVYEAPPLPVDRQEDSLVDGNGTAWQLRRDGLVANGNRRERVAGRHGLWFAFRTQYPNPTVVTGAQ